MPAIALEARIRREGSHSWDNSDRRDSSNSKNTSNRRDAQNSKNAHNSRDGNNSRDANTAVKLGSVGTPATAGRPV